MSELTEGLERISHQLSLYSPHRVHALQAGLSFGEIENVINELPFSLPIEVYELYQWHDGLPNWDFLFENYQFLPLSRAVYKYREELAQVQSTYPTIAEFFQYRFPLFENSSEGGVFLTVASDGEGGNSIYGYDIRFEDFGLRYHHLTDLILHSAEWYETSPYIEEEQRWNIEELEDHETEYKLDIKYLATERIESTQMRGGGIQKSVYQRFLESQSP